MHNVSVESCSLLISFCYFFALNLQQEITVKYVVDGYDFFLPNRNLRERRQPNINTYKEQFYPCLMW